MKEKEDVPDPFKRTIDVCTVKKRELPFGDDDPISSTFDIYEVTVKSSGFLHNQVRRMVGLALVRRKRLTCNGGCNNISLVGRGLPPR